MNLFNKLIYKLTETKLSLFFPTKIIVLMQFRLRTGVRLNLKNPKNFNEKLQVLKIYWKDKSLTKFVDKIAVREFVSERIGEKYLNELHGVYKRFSDINFEILPNKFAVKCNHGSGFNQIVFDKKNMNLKKSKKQFDTWMKTNYYFRGREFPYKNIRPKIMIEKFLVEEKLLSDYKFFSYYGQVKFIYESRKIYSLDGTHKKQRYYYTHNWEKIITENEKISYIKQKQKPRFIDEMIELTYKISKDFPFSRIDFLISENRIFFGEITFFPDKGMGNFQNYEMNKLFGKHIDLKRWKNEYDHFKSKRKKYKRDIH